MQDIRTLTGDVARSYDKDPDCPAKIQAKSTAPMEPHGEEKPSPVELEALIKNAEAQMESSRKNHVKEVRVKIDGILASAGLAIADVYPTCGSKSAKGPKVAVAPKYRNPHNASQTWSGRGKRPPFGSTRP